MKWQDIRTKKIKEQILFVSDFLDHFKVSDRYASHTMVDYKIEALSYSSILITLDRETYQKHYRKNEQLTKHNINLLIWNLIPRLNEFGMGLRNKLTNSFEIIQCSKWQILEAEGKNTRFCYIPIRGQVHMYQKVEIDPVRDTNSRRREHREINQGQT